jgi:hypothetical protein
MGDTGYRKAAVAAAAVFLLLNSGEYLLGAIVAMFYIGINGLLHLVDKPGVEDTE